MRRKRFSQLCERSTTQRLALNPASLLMALASSPPAADVSGEAKLVQRASHLVKVVAFIQAHTLGLVWTGRRSRHGQAVHRGPHQFHVMTVRPVHRQTHRNALGFGQQATLDPAFAAVSGVWGRFFPPPKGDLVMAPSILSQLQSSPFSSS